MGERSDGMTGGSPSGPGARRSPVGAPRIWTKAAPVNPRISSRATAPFVIGTSAPISTSTSTFEGSSGGIRMRLTLPTGTPLSRTLEPFVSPETGPSK